MFSHRAVRGFAKSRGFTLLEMIAVIMLILLLTAATAITLANSRSSVKVKKDASAMIAFLRNMWDQTRVSGSSLVLEPDFEKGGLTYIDPRSGQRKEAELDSGAHILGIKLNDRLYNAYSHLGRIPTNAEEEVDYDPEADVIYVSEGRGLVRVGIVMGVPVDKEDASAGFEHMVVCMLNLVNGKGKIEWLEEDQVRDIMDPSATRLGDIADVYEGDSEDDNAGDEDD